MKINEIASYIFEGAAPSLEAQALQRMADSAAYKEFMERHRDKIRKKRRGLLNNALGLSDLGVELAVAYCLLLDKRITLAYEQYTAAKIRGPDFTGAFRVNLRFNIEVTQLHAIGHTVASAQEKLTGAFCAKLGQFPAGIINVLLVAFAETPPSSFGEQELTQTFTWLHNAAARKDEQFFIQRGLAGTKDYFALMPRISAVLAWLPPHDPSRDSSLGSGRALLWANPQAKHPLTADLRRALVGAFVLS